VLALERVRDRDLAGVPVSQSERPETAWEDSWDVERERSGCDEWRFELRVTAATWPPHSFLAELNVYTWTQKEGTDGNSRDNWEPANPGASQRAHLGDSRRQGAEASGGARDVAAPGAGGRLMAFHQTAPYAEWRLNSPRRKVLASLARRLLPPFGGAGRMVATALVLPGACSGCSDVDCKHHGPMNRKRVRRAVRAEQSIIARESRGCPACIDERDIAKDFPTLDLAGVQSARIHTAAYVDLCEHHKGARFT
jgi:hypothetical protein